MSDENQIKQGAFGNSANAAAANAYNPQFVGYAQNGKRPEPITLLQELKNRRHKMQLRSDEIYAEGARLGVEMHELDKAIVALTPPSGGGDLLLDDQQGLADESSSLSTEDDAADEEEADDMQDSCTYCGSQLSLDDPDTCMTDDGWQCPKCTASARDHIAAVAKQLQNVGWVLRDEFAYPKSYAKIEARWSDGFIQELSFEGYTPNTHEPEWQAWPRSDDDGDIIDITHLRIIEPSAEGERIPDSASDENLNREDPEETKTDEASLYQRDGELLDGDSERAVIEDSIPTIPRAEIPLGSAVETFTDSGLETVRTPSGITHIITDDAAAIAETPPERAYDERHESDEPGGGANIDDIVDGLTPNQMNELRGFVYRSEDRMDVIAQLDAKLGGYSMSHISDLGKAVSKRMVERFSGCAASEAASGFDSQSEPPATTEKTPESQPLSDHIFPEGGALQSVGDGLRKLFGVGQKRETEEVS